MQFFFYFLKNHIFVKKALHEASKSSEVHFHQSCLPLNSAFPMKMSYFSSPVMAGSLMTTLAIGFPLNSAPVPSIELNTKFGVDKSNTQKKHNELLFLVKYGGIPHTRRTECAKIKISQSDFGNLKFGKKVNISRD